jgi:hypothetical protein
MSDLLDSELLEFINDCVDSVELVEVLALLAGESSRLLSAADVSKQLKTTEHSAALRLKHLCACGVAQVSEGLYRYAPSSDARAALVERFLRIYRTHRVRVIDAIFNCASKQWPR